jgi:hypothetical protein
MSSLPKHAALVAAAALAIAAIHIALPVEGRTSIEVSRVSISPAELTQSAGALPVTGVKDFI